MKLKEIFDHLTTGELSQVSIGGSTLGAVTEEDASKIARPISLGITALHKRFLLKEHTLFLNVQPGQTYYTLDPKYAVSNVGSLEAVKYIDDVWMPFEAELMKIERVYDETPAVVADYPNESQRLLVLNERDNPDSLMTPSFKSLVLPEDLEATRLKIVYRANHRQLTEDDWLEPELAEVDLPYTHLEALLLFVASRMLNPIGFAGGNGFHEGNNYAAKYEAECQLLEGKGLEIDETGANYRLVRNGWV